MVVNEITPVEKAISMTDLDKIEVIILYKLK